MPIVHSPDIDAREPADDDLKTFRNLTPGDRVSFFEWPVEPLTVLGWENDENVGQHVRVEAAGSESFLYEVDGTLWHTISGDQADREEDPFPVQNLVLMSSSDD